MTEQRRTTHRGSRPIVVIGIGNLLMGDDGIGPCVVQTLSTLALPPNVEVIDGGLGGLSILDWLDGREQAIIVDAARMHRPPGTVVRFQPSDIQQSAGKEQSEALVHHQARVLDIPDFGRQLTTLPPITIYGIEPERVVAGDRLSTCGRRARDEAVRLILAELRDLQGDDEHGQVENSLSG